MNRICQSLNLTWNYVALTVRLPPPPPPSYHKTICASLQYIEVWQMNSPLSLNNGLGRFYRLDWFDWVELNKLIGVIILNRLGLRMKQIKRQHWWLCKLLYNLGAHTNQSTPSQLLYLFLYPIIIYCKYCLHAWGEWGRVDGSSDIINRWDIW